MIVRKPESLKEAIAYLAGHPQAKIVAGGTDLIPRLNQKLETQTELCYVYGYPEMSGIEKLSDGTISIGASMYLNDVAAHPLLAGYKGLKEAASHVASWQIRNQGTIGGNILQENRCMFFNNHVPWSEVNHCYKWGGNACFQIKNSPDCVALFQSDVAPVLIAHDAEVEIQGSSGVRRLPVSGLYGEWGRRNKNLAHDEIVTRILVPALKENEVTGYVRKTIRGSFDFPLLGCASILTVENGKVTSAKAVFGACGTRPAEFKEASELAGLTPEEVKVKIRQMDRTVMPYISTFKDPRVNGNVRNEMGYETFVRSIEMCLSEI